MLEWKKFDALQMWSCQPNCVSASSSIDAKRPSDQETEKLPQAFAVSPQGCVCDIHLRLRLACWPHSSTAHTLAWAAASKSEWAQQLRL
eukprot:236348-Amphidinium_carterae.1